jgi:hypothetical protein
MAGPWEQFQSKPATKGDSGPWEQFSAAKNYYPEGDSRNEPAAVTVGEGAKPKPDASAPVASARETLNKPNSGLVTGARGALQGATFNLGDEILAGVNALTGNGSKADTFGKRYENNLAYERDQFKADAAEHPVYDIAGNIIGTIAGPAKLAKSAKGIVELAKEGAKAGALFGFGAGEGGTTERLKSAAEGAAVGAGTGAVIGGASKAFQAARPANVAARYVNKQFATPAAADSAAVAQEVGQVYTPGQATGSKGLLTIEGLVRRHPASADKMAAFDNKQLDTSLRYLDSTLNDITKAKASPDIVGDKVAGAFDDVVNKAVSTRRNTAKADFEAVDKLAGRYRVFKPDNLFGEIDNLAQQFSVPGGGDASASLVKQIQGIKDDIAKRAGPEGLNAKEVQRLLEVYGKAAKGSGAIFKDIDSAQQRMIAGRLQQAVLRDVDTAADSNAYKGEIATALKTARNNYRQNSQAIDGLENSVLGRLFGGKYERAPERIATAVKNMTPTELRSSFAILSKADPEVAQVTKRYLVEDALNTAGRTNTGAPQAQVAGEAAFSPAKYLTAIRKSPVWDTLNPQERLQMTASVRDLERLAYRGGTDGSPTAPLMFAWEVAKAMGGGVAALSPTQVAKSVAAVMIPSKIAKAVTTPEGQKALRTVRQAKPGSAAYTAATATLVGMFTAPDEPKPKP